MLNQKFCADKKLKQYIKRPLPVYAIQIVPQNFKLLEDDDRLDIKKLAVNTLEGTFNFEVGDYLIVGSDDEIWTVKEKIFEKTYQESVESIVNSYIVTDGNHLYFRNWDDIFAVVAVDVMPGADSVAKRFNTLEEAKEVADTLGWQVRKVEE